MIEIQALSRIKSLSPIHAIMLQANPNQKFTHRDFVRILSMTDEQLRTAFEKAEKVLEDKVASTITE